MTRREATGSGLATRKEIMRGLLANRDCEGLMAWAGRDRAPLRVVSALLFDEEPLIRWRAIEAMGQVAGHIVGSAPDKAHRQVQRLLWLMNDESGGLCRVAPEAIAEILYRVPALLPEFGPMLPTFFEEEPFERGSRWAVARLGHRSPDLLSHGNTVLASTLDDPDPAMRAYSWLALTAVGAEIAADAQLRLREDREVVPVYDYTTGTLANVAVSEMPAVAQKMSRL